MTEHLDQSSDSHGPVLLKEVLEGLVDADFSVLSNEEAVRKAATDRRYAEYDAQAAREAWAEPQQIPWGEADPDTVHHAGELLVEAEARLKPEDPRP